MELPSFSSYGKYRNSNYGSHCLRMDAGPLTAWFSYRTMVAFRFAGEERVVRQNEWGRTTGKHLNWIDGGDKACRVDGATFEQVYQEQAAKAFGAVAV
jgi:hypothetical protein